MRGLLQVAQGTMQVMPLVRLTAARRVAIQATARRSLAEYQYFGRRESHVHRNPRRLAVSVVLMTGLAGVYYVTHLDTVPVTGRRRFLAVTPAQEEALGESGFQQLLLQFKGQILPPSHPWSRRIEAIGRRIVAVSPLHDRPWTFHVIDSEMANCFVLPGQHVFVFTGILPILGDDDGIAGISDGIVEWKEKLREESERDAEGEEWRVARK